MGAAAEEVAVHHPLGEAAEGEEEEASRGDFGAVTEEELGNEGAGWV